MLSDKFLFLKLPDWIQNILELNWQNMLIVGDAQNDTFH